MVLTSAYWFATAIPPSTDVIVGDVSGGGGCPGERDSLCESLGKQKFEACICVTGSLVPLIFRVLV